MSDEKVPLNPNTLVQAYCAGLFPMAIGNDREIAWFSPNPRGVIPLDEFHIPHGLKKALRKDPFEIRLNTSFLEVLRGCADREETWIDSTITSAYVGLHEAGFAHSVEAWRNNQLVGGLYGVAIGAAFFGESMFSRVSNASQAALVYLVNRMKDRGFQLLDTQWSNPHLERFGCREIPRNDYLRQLAQAIQVPVSFTDGFLEKRPFWWGPDEIP